MSTNGTFAIFGGSASFRRKPFGRQAFGRQALGRQAFGQRNK
jgi:hypothetical protein